MPVNPLLVLVAIVVVVLMVAFGHNPMEERRKEMQKYGGDPLIKAIEEHNAKNKNVMPFNAPEGAGSYSGFGSAPPGTNPYMESNPYRQKTTTAPTLEAPASPQNNGYYPPPPVEGAPHSSLQQAPNDPYASLMSNGHYVRFYGEKVYTYDTTGARIPMPDGEYSLYGGLVTMQVHDGKKIVITN